MLRPILVIAALMLGQIAQAADTLGQGSFVGKSNHVASGSVAIVDEGNRKLVVFASNFKFDGAPDPKVALGSDGYDSDTILAPLKSNDGKQAYVIPDNIDPADYSQIWIWCERFNVPLALAELK